MIHLQLRPRVLQKHLYPLRHSMVRSQRRLRMARCKSVSPSPLCREGLTLVRHDPQAEGAIVMKATTPEHSQKFNKKCASTLCWDWSRLRYHYRGLPTVAVVLDPIIARHLRPHQIEGTCPDWLSCFSGDNTLQVSNFCMNVLWAYEDMRAKGASSLMKCTYSYCLAMNYLVDSQTLGDLEKPFRFVCSIDIISTCDTCYRQLRLSGRFLVSSTSKFCEPVSNEQKEQNPYAGIGPAVGKVLIVCPVSLVNVRSHMWSFVAISDSEVELARRISQVVGQTCADARTF